MSKKHRKFLQFFGISGDTLLDLLQRQAAGKCHALGHEVQRWTSAKHKYGKGAMIGTCMICGAQAIITPYGNPKGPKAAQDAPAIAGNALFEKCVSRIPAKQTHMVL